MHRPFFPGSTPGSPFMFQRGTAQATAFQQASELVAEAVDTLTVTEANGVTTATVLVQHSSKEHRDGLIESGM
jgi:hypothetical protein